MLHTQRLLWITDPWDTLDHPQDTTLRLIQEALELGVPCWWADVRSTAWSQQGTTLQVFRVQSVDAERGCGSFALRDEGRASPAGFTQVFYRPDPPVDLAYVHPLQLIAAELEKCRAELVNPASVLCLSSEKLLLSSMPSVMPPTFVGCCWDELCEFGRAQGPTVAKPLHNCQSKGVELLEWSSAEDIERASAVLGGLTNGFRRPVVLQRFLAAIHEGETRVWFIDGTPLAAARKYSGSESFRIDMDKGGQLRAWTLTSKEAAQAARIGTGLRQKGIRLAAIDLIDGLVTDANFTSPGLLVGMEAALGRNLARPIIEALTQRGAATRLRAVAR